MKTTRRAFELGRMLDLCDDLQRIRTRLADPELGREERARLRRQTERRVDQLARNLQTYRFRGPLGQRLREHRFTAVEFEILVVLLQRAVRAEEPSMEGRLILGSIFDSSFGVLSAMHLLHEDARLRASGLVIPEEDQEGTDDPLERRFRLSEDALATLRAEIEGNGHRRTAIPGRAYGSHREHLIDLRVLHGLYRLRSERVFGQRSEGLGADARSGRPLTSRIAAASKRIRERLEATPAAGEFPTVRFARRYGLDDAELMMVVHLLFSELYDGEAFADAAELLRLVSASDDQLLRNRRYLLAAAPLREHEILLLEPFVESRDLTAEAHLADWVVNELLDLGRSGAEIASDERLDWHLYLRRLEDSAGFYRDLGSS